MATKAEIRKYFAKFGRKGGRATAQRLNADQRKESARNAAKARWAKEKARHSDATSQADP